MLQVGVRQSNQTAPPLGPPVSPSVAVAEDGRTQAGCSPSSIGVAVGQPVGQSLGAEKLQGWWDANLPTSLPGSWD